MIPITRSAAMAPTRTTSDDSRSPSISSCLSSENAAPPHRRRMFEPSVERRSDCSFSRLEQWAVGSRANSDQLGMAARFEPIRVQSKRWRWLGSVRDAGNKSRERTHQIWLQTVSRLSRNRDRYAAGAVVCVLSVNCFCLTTIHPTPRREKADFIGMNWGELGALPRAESPC